MAFGLTPAPSSIPGDWRGFGQMTRNVVQLLLGVSRHRGERSWPRCRSKLSPHLDGAPAPAYAVTMLKGVVSLATVASLVISFQACKDDSNDGARASGGSAGVGNRSGDGGHDEGGNATMDLGGDAGGRHESNDGGRSGLAQAGMGVPAGAGGEPTSLAGAGGGDATCTACTSIAVPAGTFMMGRSANGADSFTTDEIDELPEHEVSISTFSLDRFEVTVGRFRRFVDDYDGWRAAGNPMTGTGANVAVELAHPGYKSGWNAGVAGAPDRATLVQALKCDAADQTWTDVASTHEEYPINCVDWYMAFAFCIWDGGRLPTEAEWEYVAAGGDENRLYPWGAAAPTATLANYAASDKSPLIPVGSKPAGAGRWGHVDLAGSVSEWTLDFDDDHWYSATAATGADPANLTQSGSKMHRGAGYVSAAKLLRAADRFRLGTGARDENIGFRCARDVE